MPMHIKLMPKTGIWEDLIEPGAEYMSHKHGLQKYTAASFLGESIEVVGPCCFPRSLYLHD